MKVFILLQGSIENQLASIIYGINASKTLNAPLYIIRNVPYYNNVNHYYVYSILYDYFDIKINDYQLTPKDGEIYEWLFNDDYMVTKYAGYKIFFDNCVLITRSEYYSFSYGNKILQLQKILNTNLSQLYIHYNNFYNKNSSFYLFNTDKPELLLFGYKKYMTLKTSMFKSFNSDRIGVYFSLDDYCTNLLNKMSEIIRPMKHVYCVGYNKDITLQFLSKYLTDVEYHFLSESVPNRTGWKQMKTSQEDIEFQKRHLQLLYNLAHCIKFCDVSQFPNIIKITRYILQ